jgi:hypothetical protein
MKKVLVIAAMLVMLLPVTAMAGMTAFMDMDELSSSDMSDVTGQTGITIYAAISILNGYVSWSDDNGCNAFGTGAFVTLATIKSSMISIDGLTIDACNDGTTSYISISIPTLTLNQSISAIRIGTLHAVGANGGLSLGRIDQTNITIGSSYLRISAHN